MELLKQGQGEPYPVEEEVVSIFLGTRGHLDSVPVEDVSRFETEFLEHVRRDGGALSEIRDSGKLSDETEERLNKAVSEFKEQFGTTDGSGVTDDGGTGELGSSEESDEESSDDSTSSNEGQGSSGDSAQDSSHDSAQDSSGSDSDGSSGSHSGSHRASGSQD